MTPAVRSPRLPLELADQAGIAGIEHARVWGDEPPPYTAGWMDLGEEELRRRYADAFGKPHAYLAISGGGAQGAFGAGILAGWSEVGTRPEFTVVTGISTGALCAPYAFLGSAYDDRLREVYTTHSTRDLIRKRALLTALFKDALADTAPLRGVIASHITREVLDEIAEKTRGGRSISIGTTNLDAGRPVIWRINQIAKSGVPAALELVRDVMLASASIPAVFPPVMIEVAARGRRYHEMHVDGGAATQVFFYPEELDWAAVLRKLRVPERPTIYVIRNAFVTSEPEIVRPRLTSIAGRTISSLIRTQGFGDMYRVYLAAQRDGLDYRLAYIPDEFAVRPREAFDPVYMNELFELGRALAKSGEAWHHAPPGFE